MEYVIELSEDKHELIKMAAAAGIGDWVYRVVAKGKPLKKEPKTGHWIADVDKWGDVVTTVNGYRCDKCNAFNSDKDKYCPNCGANMIGPQAESEDKE